jgi:nicotinate-nucleotide adenylyltransferase
LGADAFLGIPTWHRWHTLFDLAHIAVAPRPGFALDAGNPQTSPELRSLWQQRYRDQAEGMAGNILLREITALDISSSHIRQALNHQRSPRYLLPEAVCDYIQTQHLYEKKHHGT